MEYRKLGNSDITVSVISFGAWSIGGQPFWENKDDKVSISAIKKAFDSGINLFDTAPVYGFGHSEEIIGKALKKYRKEVIIATKCGLRWNNNKVYHNLKKDSILEEIDLSLKRLKTDFIDLYQVHWPDPDTPIEETMTALKKIQESGKIRYIGVSNFTVPMMKECLKYAEIISLQPGYNLFDRKIEKDIIPFCIENNIGIIAYSPLASGILTGKYNKKTKFKDWRGKFGEMFKKDVYPGLIDKTEKLKNYLKITNRKLHHLAIKWVIIQKGITSAIVGANTPEQVEDNIKALNLKISENDLNYINDITT